MAGRRSTPDLLGRFPKASAAIAFARREHAEQTRSADGAPFIEHPLEVGLLLHRVEAPDAVIAAGILHDTLEKTPATRDELRARFGDRVAALVSAVTEDE